MLPRTEAVCCFANRIILISPRRCTVAIDDENRLCKFLLARGLQGILLLCSCSLIAARHAKQMLHMCPASCLEIDRSSMRAVQFAVN